MFSTLIMAGVIAISSPNMDFPKVWEKIDGQWSYVGKVKEKPQVLFWLEKKTKTQSKNLLINEMKFLKSNLLFFLTIFNVKLII